MFKIVNIMIGNRIIKVADIKEKYIYNIADILNDSGLCGKEFHGYFIMGG